MQKRADILRDPWIASTVNKDLSTIHRGVDVTPCKGKPVQVIEIHHKSSVNDILHITVSDSFHYVRARVHLNIKGQPTRGVVIHLEKCSVTYDKKRKQLLLDIETFSVMGEGAATYGNPNDVLDEKPIKELMKKLRGSSDLTKSQPSSPAAPPQSSGPSQIGTQVLATQVALPTKQSYQMKAGVKARAPTNKDLLSLLARKPNVRQDPNLPRKPTAIEEISSAQIPTVLSQVSDAGVSQLPSNIGAKASSRPTMNSDKVASITAGDKPPLVNSNSDESEKENSQERLGRTKATIPSRTTNNSHRIAQPEGNNTSEDLVDRFSANPFEGMTKIPRKYVQIPKDQVTILERKDAWYEPPSTTGPLYAVVPVKVRKEFLAHLSSREQAQGHTAATNSEISGSESDDESENEHAGDPKSGQETRSPSAKVKEKLDPEVPTGGLTQERTVSRDSQRPSPKNDDGNPIANEGVLNSSGQKTSASEVPWAQSPLEHQKETLASLARKQKEPIVESTPQGAPVAELPIALSLAVLKSTPAVDQSTSREATLVPQPDLLQKAATAGQSMSREATPLFSAVTPAVDPSTSRERTPVPQPDILHEETVVGQNTSRETTPLVELPKSAPQAVPRSFRRFPPVNFPSSSGIESELELDELHAEGEEVEGEHIKESDKNIAQVPGTSQEVSSTALRGSREVQVEKSPFVDGSKSPQKNKLASSSDRRIPATFKLDSSKPEEFQDAMSSIPNSSAPKSSSPGLFVTQNEEPGRNLAGVEDSDSEYASAEDNTFNQLPSSPFQTHAMRSSPPVLSPSTPNRSQPAGSVIPRGSMNGTPSREPMQGSPHAQVACTIPNSSGILNSSQRFTARSNLQDLNISSSPPSIPQGGLAALDGASDHSPTNITPSKRRLAAIADAIRQEESTRRDTKEMARDRRHEFLLRLQAEPPDIIPQTRPQPPGTLDSEYKAAAPVEPLVKEIVEKSRQLSSPRQKQAPVAAAPQATPRIANEIDSKHRPSKLLERGEEQSARIEEEDNTVDHPWSPSRPRASGNFVYDPKKDNSPWNDRPSPSPSLPKSFSKSPIESPGSEKSGMSQTLRPPVMQNNVLVTQDYHQKFRAAYPDYHESRNHFTWVLVYVQWLRDTRHALPKCLIDVFIAIMSSDFMQHVRESRDSGREVMTGWDFFDQMLDSSWTKEFDQGIIDDVPRALESLDQSLVTTYRGHFEKPGALQTQPPEATPTTGNKPALTAPKSATKKTDLGATENHTPMEITTKSKVPRSLLGQKNATQSATNTPTREPLTRHPSLVKFRQDTASLLGVETEEPNAVGSPDLSLDVDVRPKRKFESSGFVHDDEHRGIRKMPPAKRPSSQGARNGPDVFITATIKKPQDKLRNSFSSHPSFETPSLAVVANSSRSAQSPHAAVDDRRTPILQRNSSSPHPSTFKTPSLLALATNPPHTAKDNKITTPTVQKPQFKPRNSSSPHPSTFKTPSLSALANSSRLAKSPHAVMDEKTKVEEWNYEPDDEDEELLQSKSRGLLANLKRKPPPEIIQPSAKRQSMADDKVVSNEELPPSASKSLSHWNELQRSKSMDYLRQEKVGASETLQSNNVRLLNELKRKSSAESIQPSANRHSKANNKVIPGETPQSTTSRTNNLKRKSTSESVPRSAKRKSMTFKEFLPNSEFLRKRRESGSLSLSSRNSTPVGQRFEAREEKGKGKKSREPETQGWFQ